MRLPLALILCVPLLAAKAESMNLTNIHDRNGTSLDGEWPIVIDPYETGTITYLSDPRKNGFWSAPGPSTPEDPHEWNFTADEVLQVPGDWNSQREDLFFYEGTVWYRRAFESKPAPGRRTFLCFGGAATRATTWVNGEELGSHAVGFTPFHYEVTDLLRDGENDVTVRVNNERRIDGVPALNTDWWNYGGITREVRLVETPATFMRTFAVEFDGEQITATLEADGPDAANAELTFEVPALGLRATGRTNGDGRGVITARAPADLERWSPESPTLYDVRVTLGEDALNDRVGFRTLATRGGEILVNGEPVFLRGICLHEEALSREGRATGEADARELLALAQELGCNYVRLAHYPHNEHMLRVADELGLLVWAEIPVYWTLTYDREETLAEAKVHLTEMIERDRNRASVILWSVGNETGDDPVRTKFRLALGEHVKSLDPSRLLSAAMFARAEMDDDNPVKLIVEDPFGELADVLAINSYIGWYWADVEDLRHCEVERKWDKPLLVSEFGAGIKRGFRGSPTDRWTEEFGLRIYRETLDWTTRIEGLAGLSPWILKDFRSPRRQLTGIQDWYNLKGMVDHHGHRKDVFGLLQAHYGRIAAERAAGR